MVKGIHPATEDGVRVRKRYICAHMIERRADLGPVKGRGVGGKEQFAILRRGTRGFGGEVPGAVVAFGCKPAVGVGEIGGGHRVKNRLWEITVYGKDAKFSSTNGHEYFLENEMAGSSFVAIRG
jgi:hypothetical protein